MNTRGSAEGSARFDDVDVIRALAALLVVWAHVSESFVDLAGSGFWVEEASREIQAGRLGVNLFFLVSGFVIPSSLRQGGSRAEALRGFAIRRFFRLYPLFWLSVPFGFLTIWSFFGREVEPATLLANLTMVPGALGFARAQGLYWTLEVELLFYLLCAALFAAGVLGRSWGPALAFYACATVYAVLRLCDHLDVFQPAGWNGMRLTLVASLGLMFLGAMLRRVRDREPGARKVAVAATSLWLLVIAVSRMVPGMGGPGLELGYVVVILVFSIGVFKLPLRSRALAWVGRISYSIYLFHPVVFYSVLKLATLPGFVWIAGWPLYAYVLSCALLTLVLSAFLFRFVERPMMDLGARLASRPQRQPAEA